MLMLLRNEDGTRSEAVLLAASSLRLRVAVKDSDDAMELRRSLGRWLSDTGEEIEVEALMQSSAQEQVAPLAEARAIGAVAAEYWMG